MSFTRKRPTSVPKAAMMLAALAIIAAACTSGDAEPTTIAPPETTTTEATTTTAPPETTTTEATTTTAAPPPVVEVQAVDYGYVGLPAEIEAGTEIRLVNESETELHEFVAIKLPDDETRSVLELVQLPPEELAAFFPGVATVIIAPPSEAGFPVEGSGVLTQPGRYAIICAIPTGADPAEYLAAAAEAQGGPPEVAGGPPHFVQGMIGEVVVNG